MRKSIIVSLRGGDFGIFGMFGMGWGYAPKTGQGRADGAGLEAEFRRGSF